MMIMRALAVVCVMAGIAAAQAPNPNQAEADKYFAEGRDQLMTKNDPAAACAAFEKAIELDPLAPGVMLNLGLCNELQTKRAPALYWFRKAAIAALEAKLPDYASEAQTHMDKLVKEVVIAQVKNVPDNARVTVGGRPVRREEYLRLEVDPGETVEVRAPGKAPFRAIVEVEGQTAKDVVVVMTDEVEAPMRDPGKGRRRLAYIVGATGVVVWGITLAYGLVVRSRYEDQDDSYYQGNGGFDDAKDDLRFKGTGLFLLGTAAVGAAIVLYVTSPKPYRERVDQARVLPIVTPDQVGFGYSRAF